MSLLATILAHKVWAVLIIGGAVVVGSGSYLGYSYYRGKVTAKKAAQEQSQKQATEQPSQPAETPKTAVPKSTGVQSSGQTGATSTQTTTVQAKTINNVAKKFDKKSFGHCVALAPADWATTTNAEGTGADLWSSDQSLHAGWGIAATNTMISGSPDDGFFNQWMPLAGFSGFSWTSSSRDAGYEFKERDFSSSGKKGTILYKTYNIDGFDYINSVYMADANADKWDAEGATPSYVAISIRCTVQLRPNTSDPGGSPSSSSNNSDVSLSDKWTEAIMGYENVYSPSTGEHYEAPLNSKWDAGPDGPGYYRSVPNGYEKLERGFGSY